MVLFFFPLMLLLLLILVSEIFIFLSLLPQRRLSRGGEPRAASLASWQDQADLALSQGSGKLPTLPSGAEQAEVFRKEP